MFNILKRFLLMVQEFVNKYIPMLVEMLDDLVKFKPSDTSSSPNTEMIRSDVSPPFTSPFFSSQEEENSYLNDLARFIKIKDIRPELVYYMFCYAKKVDGTKVDNEMKNFLLVPKNSEDIMNLVCNYPKLRDKLLVNGTYDLNASRAFNLYLFPILFSEDTTIYRAKYTMDFFRLIRQ